MEIGPRGKEPQRLQRANYTSLGDRIEGEN